MKVVKFPDQYAPSDFSDYIVERGIELGLCDSFGFKALMTRAFKRILTEFSDKYMLMMVIEHLLHGPFVQKVGVTEKLVSTGVVEVALRQLGTQSPWKFLYYRRFILNQGEAEYYDYMLGILEDARTAPSGSSPPKGTWESNVTWATNKLNAAIITIKGRQDCIGGVEQFTYTPPPVEYLTDHTLEILRRVKEMRSAANTG